MTYSTPTYRNFINRLWEVLKNKLAKLEDALAPLVVTPCHNLKRYLTHSLTHSLSDGVTTRDAIASKKHAPDLHLHHNQRYT